MEQRCLWNMQNSFWGFGTGGLSNEPKPGYSDKPHDYWLGRQQNGHSLMNKSNEQWFQTSSRLMLQIAGLICNKTTFHLGDSAG